MQTTTEVDDLVTVTAIGGAGHAADLGFDPLRALAGFVPGASERERGAASLIKELAVVFTEHDLAVRASVLAALNQFYDEAEVRALVFTSDFQYAVRAVCDATLARSA